MDASTLTPDQLKQRAVREAQRGRVRDENGKIVFSREQLLQRQAHFETKLEGYKLRIANIKKILKNIEGQL